MLYRTIVRSKLDYVCIVYGTASNTNLRQIDSIHNAGLRLALGAFCTSPVSSMYTETNEAPLEERRLKLSINYYLKTRACTDNPAHHALHEQPQEICISLGQMEEEEWPDPRQNPPEDTNLSARNTWIRSEETQPHWRGEQMHDHKRRGSGQIQRV